ncbi:hypothetical protein OO25_13665 [Phaeobacter sp. S60]|nr:hypothetical protein OO25_13665 [Phaeobacter sp. S60]
MQLLFFQYYTTFNCLGMFRYSVPFPRTAITTVTFRRATSMVEILSMISMKQTIGRLAGALAAPLFL